MLSEKAQKLIPKARIVNFQKAKKNYSDQVINIFQQADDQGKYLTDEDLETIQNLSSKTMDGIEKAKLLRDNADKIVNQSREKVLEKFPKITEPNGELFPPSRAEACWRDFWHFLRCVTYGIAASTEEFTSEEGLYNMQLLYQELKVPLPAMIVGLENLKYFSKQLFSSSEKEKIEPYFNHLINKMRAFN